MGFLGVPSLAGDPRRGLIHFSTVLLSSASETVGCEARSLSCVHLHLGALPDLTVLSLHMRVCGVAPGHRGRVRITAVVIVQTFIWVFFRLVDVLMWILLVPSLTLSAAHSVVHLTTIVLSITRNTHFVFALGDVAALVAPLWIRRVAPRSNAVSVWVPAVVKLQPVSRGWRPPVIMGEFGPPLLADQSTFCCEDFASVVLTLTHDALSHIHFLLIEVTVDVPLHFGMTPISDPRQVFTGDCWTALVVESSAV